MKRNVLIGGAVGLVIVVLAWYFIVYSPIGDDLTTTQASVATEAGKTQSLRADLARLNAQQKSATEQEALLRKFDQAIPAQPDLGEFIVEANNIADEAGIDFLSIAPSPPVASGASSTISLNISVSGSFFQIENYLTRLEKMDRLVIIDGLNISAGASTTGSSTGETSLSVTLTGRMFTRAAPTVAGAVTPPTTTPGSTTSSTTVPGGSSTSSTVPSGSSTTGGT